MLSVVHAIRWRFMSRRFINRPSAIVMWVGSARLNKSSPHASQCTHTIGLPRTAPAMAACATMRRIRKLLEPRWRPPEHHL